MPVNLQLARKAADAGVGGQRRFYFRCDLSFRGSFFKGLVEGDMNDGGILIGEGAGMIEEIKSAADVVRQVVKDAERIMKKIFSEYKGKCPIVNHGLIPHDKLHEVFTVIDVLVVPSIMPEAFGLVVQEAFSAGLPVIATKTGGLEGLVRDGIDGFIAERNNPHSLALVMQKIIDDHDLIKKLSEQAPYIKIEGEYVDEIEAIYQKLILAEVSKTSTTMKMLDFRS